MSYRRYRSWRNRDWQNYKPSKYSVFTSLFGDAVRDIRDEFLRLSEAAKHELFADYGEMGFPLFPTHHP